MASNDPITSSVPITNSGPFDKRSIFFKEYFNNALDYDAFVESGNQHEKDKWHSITKSISLNSQQSNLISSFKRQMNVLVLAGLWCGDCSRQGPMINLIAKSARCIDLRFIDNQAYPDLRDELRISGGARVPVVLVLSEDFFEMSRFGDRHLSVYRRKAANELGETCDIGRPPKDNSELLEELSEWVEYFERIQLMLRLSPFLRKRYSD